MALPSFTLSAASTLTDSVVRGDSAAVAEGDTTTPSSTKRAEPAVRLVSGTTHMDALEGLASPRPSSEPVLACGDRVETMTVASGTTGTCSDNAVMSVSLTSPDEARFCSSSSSSPASVAVTAGATLSSVCGSTSAGASAAATAAGMDSTSSTGGAAAAGVDANSVSAAPCAPCAV
ncbi:hypothetical protein EON62_02605 [archaeon]|nr:MAG: hypothetical protein EON62_02605 [archaeon]